MGFGVCFHFEDNDRDVWSGRPVDLDAWRYAVKAFGGDRLAVVNLAGAPLAMNDEAVALEEHASLDDFLAAYARDACVCVERGGEDLASYEHPGGDCWYLFGGTAAALPRADVEVRTPFALHPVHVAPIVLWDRVRKGGV